MFETAELPLQMTTLANVRSTNTTLAINTLKDISHACPCFPPVVVLKITDE